ncbi:hypothetical protein B0T26DRAFT_107988 [Lasiosphaeria miniovina]|uniref:Uncharacterized protein n=1 Tax=Lasiosphaeria miniovina TaxID=1954250 RepID=A0AA40B3D6_9PEZI|nr:uncharacterized protein B0T26DRAFT_107988 [Lasiosphaeria miniovina]KAK0726912.1 hypothetical protein B0T26DRAFT_107988 [Lasiosphaeria miniovina]
MADFFVLLGGLIPPRLLQHASLLAHLAKDDTQAIKSLDGALQNTFEACSAPPLGHGGGQGALGRPNLGAEHGEGITQSVESVELAPEARDNAVDPLDALYHGPERRNTPTHFVNQLYAARRGCGDGDGFHLGVAMSVSRVVKGWKWGEITHQPEPCPSSAGHAEDAGAGAGAGGNAEMPGAVQHPTKSQRRYEHLMQGPAQG